MREEGANICYNLINFIEALQKLFAQ